jgi:acyl-CoA synthetase (NDP forming)
MSIAQSERARGALDGLFASWSVLFVGATAKSIWTNSALGNLERFGFPGKVHLVNRKGEPVAGKAAATSALAVGEAIDTALLMVPAAAMNDALDDIAAAGIRQAIVLSAGFGEVGEAGAALQHQLVARAAVNGVRLLGPNCLGFVNYSRALPLWTVPVRRSRRVGRVAIVSQSGAVADEMQGFAHRQGVGISFMASTGNEADIGISEIIDFLIENEEVASIALFLESVRNPDRFRAAVRRARRAGKPITLLKIGSSPTSSRLAQTHTGALVGDDHIFSAMCESEGLIRVASLEDLVLTADLMARLPTPGAGGLALGALSGGVCEIAADRAHQVGLELAEIGTHGVAELETVLPHFAKPQNPLDVTGGAMLQPELLRDAVSALSRDPAVAATAFVMDAPTRPDDGGFRSAALQALSAGFSQTGKPALLMSNMLAPVSDAAIVTVDACDLVYFSGGVDLGVLSLKHFFRWHQTRSAAVTAPEAEPAPPNAPNLGSERDVLEYLKAHGVPVIPAQIARNASDAAAAAKQFGSPIALKILAAGLAHKSEVGGVMLNVTLEDVGPAYERLVIRVSEARPDLAIEGVIVAPMRRDGLELIVGVTRDPQWGPVLTLGLGGVLVEALKDFSSRLLPVDVPTVLEMLDDLRTSPLLDGFRDSPAVDRRRVAEVVCAIARAAERLGPALASLEVNPLRAVGDHVECLDGLVEWQY